MVNRAKFRHLVWLTCGVLLLAIVSGHEAYASEMVYLPFGTDRYGIAKYVVVVKVLRVTKNAIHAKLKNGSEGPKIADELRIEGEVVERLKGAPPTTSILAIYRETTPAQYDENGVEISHSSPILSGSGMEWNTVEGSSYIVSLTNVGTEKPGVIMRIDPLSARDEIIATLRASVPPH